jgi:hypothetical protein
MKPDGTRERPERKTRNDEPVVKSEELATATGCHATGHRGWDDREFLIF